MKKRFLALIAVLVLSLSLFAACKKDDNPGNSGGTPENPPAIETVTVTFNSNGGTAVAPITVNKGDKITAPEVMSDNSTLEIPLIFDGWYLDDVAWDFDDGVSASMTLVAHWKEDGRYTEPVIPKA